MEVADESSRDKAARRRAKRLQHLIPDDALRRSPRIRRSGVTPFYGPAPRRASRESSLAMEDDASSVASSGSRRSRSSRRSSRASEILNESGQVLYEEGSESEADQDDTVVDSGRISASHGGQQVNGSVNRALRRLTRSPRFLSSADSGVVSGSGGVAQGNVSFEFRVRAVAEAGGGEQTDLPQHLYGPDSDGGLTPEVDFRQTTQFVFNKERVLPPVPPRPVSPPIPPPPPGPLASCLVRVKQVASLPYIALVSLLTFDLLLLERLSLLLAIATNPIRRKKSWFGLLLLILALLGFTWRLTVITAPVPPITPGGGVSSEELEKLSVSLLSDMRGYVGESSTELLQWLQGNLTQLSEIQSKLAADLDSMQNDSATQFSAVTAQLAQHNDALDVLSAMKDQLTNLTDRLVGLEQQVADLQATNHSVHGELQQLRVEVSDAVGGAKDLKEWTKDELLVLKREGQSAEQLSTLVQEQLDKMLGKDGGGVFGSWLQSQMIGVVREKDMDAFNASLREFIAEWGSRGGGLSRPEVEGMIQTVVRLYDADKTGKFDYALELSGGSIPHALCSETFTPSASTVQLFGYTVWHYSNSPRTTIQPGVLPGQCWAFSGMQGYVVIKLATDIHLTEVTVEHIPKILSPTGEIESAPKEFALYVGVTEEEERQFLGNYTYYGKEPRQTIPVEPSDRVVRYVEFRFLTNHGNKDYTCVYRLRVHGRPAAQQRTGEGP